MDRPNRRLSLVCFPERRTTIGVEVRSWRQLQEIKEHGGASGGSSRRVSGTVSHRQGSSVISMLLRTSNEVTPDEPPRLVPHPVGPRG